MFLTRAYIIAMRTVSVTITKALSGRSLASALKTGLRLSASLIARLKTSGGILKNGVPAKTNERVYEGDAVAAIVGESPAETGRAPLPFPILFEDDDILIIDKPAGACVHGSRYDDTALSIEDAVNAYYGRPGLFHPVSRLDRGTTGVMTIAKNGWMHELLMQKLHTDEYERTYLGICEGRFTKKEGVIDLPIARTFGSAIRREVNENGAPAVTEYRVIEENERFSLVRFRLRTGRTHQIRVHASALGHPLAGDWLYGTEDKKLIERPALHSEKLTFTHPWTGERTELASPLPEDMKKLID